MLKRLLSVVAQKKCGGGGGLGAVCPEFYGKNDRKRGGKKFKNRKKGDLQPT